MIGGNVGEAAKCKSAFADQSQVILVKARGVFAGKTRHNSICLPEGPDEKEFWLLSH